MRDFIFHGRAFESNLLRPIGVTAGGARRNRTDDLLLAKQALSQLSYGPGAPEARRIQKSEIRSQNSECHVLISDFRFLISAAPSARHGGPGKI